jgi:ParB family chromosome partitioning protein
MALLPLLVDAEDAIDYAKSNRMTNDALLAWIVATLSREGYLNRDIREVLVISEVYRVTHLKRVGLALSEDEMELWHQNPKRITLGHVRAIWKLPRKEREKMLRNLLLVKTPVSEFERIARGEGEERDCDIERFETLMGETLGRKVSIHYKKAKQTGTLTLDFFTLDDLEEVASKLGFQLESF